MTTAYSEADQQLPNLELGLSRSKFAHLIAGLYSPRAPRVFRNRILSMVGRFEGGPMRSYSLRKLLLMHHGARIGAYSYGPIVNPGIVPGKLVVGRYVSVAPGVMFLRRNHLLDALSTHAFFMNSRLGVIDRDPMVYEPLLIEHDAWIGARAIITPGCKRIGLGAVVAAGAVVTKDVQDFAIGGGNPARVIRSRFSPEIAQRVRDSRWWELTLDQIRPAAQAMIDPLNECFSTHPLLADRPSSPPMSA